MKTRTQENLAVYSIGLKLRVLRNEKHLTLVRLASETRLSPALLSKLENGAMLPTLQTLERICRVYGVGLGYFFCEPAHHSLSITRHSHLADGRAQPGAKVTPLHLPTAESKLDSMFVELPAGAPSTTGAPGSPTEVTVYVFEGTLHLSIAGSLEVLEQGDCVVMRTDQVVVWSAGTNSRCRFLLVAAR